MRPPQTDASPLPTPDQHTRAFWEALCQGVLLLQQCEVCAELAHPAATRCWSCESPLLSWLESTDSATLFSWAIESRSVIPGMTPRYVVAQFTPEGCDADEVRIVATLLVDDPDRLRLGMDLRIRTVSAPGSNVSLLVVEPR